MLISDLEHLEVLAEEQNLVGGTLTQGVFSLTINGEEIISRDIGEIPNSGLELTLDSGRIVIFSAASADGKKKAFSLAGLSEQGGTSVSFGYSSSSAIA